MAKQRPKRRIDEVLADVPEKKGDFAAFLQHLQENPVLYVVGAAFFGLAVIAGILFNLHREASDRQLTTLYARALDSTEAEARAAELERLSEAATGELAAEVAYMLAESAFRAGDYEKARTHFQRVRSEHGQSRLAPDAVEGLGYVAEELGDYETAAAYYTEVRDTWPGVFTAYRQPLNLGRVYEKLGNHEEAVEAYQAQIMLLPGSMLAAEAEQALARLRISHPSLFPEDAAEGEPVQPVESTPPAPGAVPGGLLPSLEGIAPEDAPQPPAEPPVPLPEVPGEVSDAAPEPPAEPEPAPGDVPEPESAPESPDGA